MPLTWHYFSYTAWLNVRMPLRNKFMFATGIENSYPTIQLPDGSVKRVDEMEKCCHYQNWQTDFELVGDLGISFLRYGAPYYQVHLGPGRYDWTFTDDTFIRLKELNITPTSVSFLSRSYRPTS